MGLRIHGDDVVWNRESGNVELKGSLSTRRSIADVAENGAYEVEIENVLSISIDDRLREMKTGDILSLSGRSLKVEKVDFIGNLAEVTVTEDDPTRS